VSGILLSLGVLLCVGSAPAQAQSGNGWSPAVGLSSDVLDDAGEPADAFRPVAVADAWGQVHAFWGARTAAQAGVIGNTIYYARWDEYGWSGPYDVISVGDLVNHHAVPRIAVDEDGWLHLVWVKNDSLLYSRASVWQAADTRAWAQPAVVTNGPLPPGDNLAAIVIDSQATIHVVYSLGAEGGTYMHICSDDGVIWSDPQLVAIGSGGEQIKAAVDEQDRLHVVYKMEYPDGSSVYYTRSQDRGTTWSEPLLVDESDERYQSGYGPNLSNVIARGERVHIVWHGAPRSQRWHQWSGDGGVTWSGATQISPDLVFSTNPPEMSSDGSGILHLVSVGAGVAAGDEGTAVLHTSWQGSSWTPLELVSTESDERADVAIGNGSTLVVVWDNRAAKDNAAGQNSFIWASAKDLDSSPLAVAPLPSPAATTAVSASLPTRTTEPASTATWASHQPSYGSGRRKMQDNPVISVWMGALAAMLLVFVIVLLRRPWR